MSVERVLLFILDDWRRPRGWRLVVSSALILGLLLLGWAVVVATGGPPNPRIHVLYVPVVLAAFAFGGPGGLLVGALAGLAAGPFASFGAAVALEADWFYRPLAFGFVGLLTGEVMNLLNRRIELSREMEDSLARGYARTLRGFACVVAMRDELTGGHCERVATNACEMGIALGLEDHEVEALYWAGMLHDLGKVGVPESILLKPSSLTEEEFERMKDHAAMGELLVGSLSPAFGTIAEAVGAHHERWDGGGYPRGLATHRIPLFGRILALVDNFEALTCERPYREALPPEDVIEYLRRGAGTHFDPCLVPIFERLWRNGRILVADEEAMSEKLDTVEAVVAALSIEGHTTFRSQDHTVTSVHGRPLSIPDLSQVWRRTWLSRRSTDRSGGSKGASGQFGPSHRQSGVRTRSSA